jgi:hypothetical protein
MSKENLILDPALFLAGVLGGAAVSWFAAKPYRDALNRIIHLLSPATHTSPGKAHADSQTADRRSP